MIKASKDRAMLCTWIGAGVLMLALALACFAAWDTHPGAGVGYAAGMTSLWLVMSLVICAVAGVVVTSINDSYEQAQKKTAEAQLAMDLAAIDQSNDERMQPPTRGE